MILSQVILKPQRLDNAWEWHRALWTLFPGIERQANESAPFLYRIESMNLADGARVLMLSDREPEIESKRARVLAKKTFEPIFTTGQPLRFLLTANVTKAIRDKDQPERKIRVPLIREDQQIDWLRRKLEPATRIVSVTVQQHPPVYFRKGARPGKIVPLTFGGLLEVQSGNDLLELMQKGIGPAKAFGCGLLLVRRA